MKKLYSIALAATLAVSASAADINKMMRVAATEAQPVEISNIAKAPAKAAIANMDELIGIYDGTNYSGFASGLQTGIYSIRQSAANKVKILGFGLGYEIEGTVDFAAKTITFEGNQVVGAESDGTPVYCRHYRWNDNGQGIYACPAQDIVLVLKDDGTIKFDDRTAIPGTNQAYGSFDIFFIGTDESLAGNSGYGCNYAPVFTKVADTSADWQTVGEEGGAQITDDGWVCPMWTFEFPALACTYQVNKTNSNLVRITGAYSTMNEVGGYNFNLSALPGEIVFNITDPTCVIVEMNHFSGYQSEDEGMYYLYNLEATNIEEGLSYEECIEGIKAFFGEDAVSTFDTENGVLNIKNCVFGFTGQADRAQALNEWLPASAQCTETATIVLPEGWNSAIKGIEADNTNAPVEYFNLQGIRVANPENGVFIRRQGTQVTKVVR